ncbi:MAG: hypothetical protein ABIG44_02905 [Planctomycetota bacterium]
MAHKFIAAMWKTKAGVEQAVKERVAEDWRARAIGEIFGSVIVILKRPQA